MFIPSPTYLSRNRGSGTPLRRRGCGASNSVCNMLRRPCLYQGLQELSRMRTRCQAKLRAISRKLPTRRTLTRCGTGPSAPTCAACAHGPRTGQLKHVERPLPFVLAVSQILNFPAHASTEQDPVGDPERHLPRLRPNLPCDPGTLELSSQSLQWLPTCQS